MYSMFLKTLGKKSDKALARLEGILWPFRNTELGGQLLFDVINEQESRGREALELEDWMLEEEARELWSYEPKPWEPEEELPF